jgi:hypothetical protein
VLKISPRRPKPKQSKKKKKHTPSNRDDEAGDPPPGRRSSSHVAWIEKTVPTPADREKPHACARDRGR